VKRNSMLRSKRSLKWPAVVSPKLFSRFFFLKPSVCDGSLSPRPFWQMMFGRLNGTSCADFALSFDAKRSPLDFFGLSRHQRTKICVTLGFFFLLCPHYGLAGSMTAQVDETSFENGEEIPFSVEIEGDLDKEIQFPSSQDFKVSGTSRSTQVQVINGRFSKKNVYQFSLQPMRSGKLVIPSLEAKIDGVIEKTLPIPISVGMGSGSNSPSNNNQGGSNPGANQQGQMDSNPSQQGNVSDLFLVEREISKGPYYLHQPVVETIKVMRRVDWQSAAKSTDNSSNWQVFEVTGEEQSMETRGGVSYRSITLKRVLVPLKSGDLSLPGWSLAVEFIDLKKRRGMNPFDIFSQVPISKRLISAPGISIKVKNLPEANLPVGTLDPSVDLSSVSVNVGDSVTLSFVVSGQGWFSGMGIEPPSLTGSFKSYLDKPLTAEDITPNGIVGKKTVKLSLVPSEPGTLSLPSWKFRYFDPKVEKIIEKLVSIPEIKVTGEKEELILGGKSSEKIKPSVKQSDLEPDFYFGKSFGSALDHSDMIFLRWLFGLSFVLLLVSSILKIRSIWRRSKNPDQLLALQEWRKMLKGIQKSGSADEVVKIFRDYAASRLGSSPPSVTYRDVSLVLQEDGWRTDLVKQLTDLFLSVDARKFGGKNTKPNWSSQDLWQEAKRKKPCN